MRLTGLLIMPLVLALITGCSKKKEILFCEGVTPEGEGVKCGSTFSTGDLSLLYKRERNFEAEGLTVQIYELKEERREKVESISVPVKPDAKSMTALLSLYNAGTYEIQVKSADAVLAIEKLVIVDQ